MSEAYRRLGASLPQRRVPAAGAFAGEARTLRAWIDALPMANFGVAAAAVLDGLRQLNGQRVDAAQRLEGLEMLRQAVLPLAASADQQIIGVSFPLPAQKAELGDLALAFQSELALGYRIALVELCAPAGAVGFLRNRAVVLAAVRALQHGHEHLARAYLLYRTPPSRAWQALHDVHRFIAAARLDDRAIEERDALQSTARVNYLQALLLALTNPYRHTQREQVDAAAFARMLAPHAELRERGGGERDVLVHMDADRGPGYLPEERAGAARDVLALRLERALAFIDEQLERTPPGARSATFRQRGGAALALDLDLARRFAVDLGARAERSDARLGGGYLLDSVLGLHDLHAVLAGGEDFERFLRRARGDADSETERGAIWRGVAATRANLRPVRVLDQSLRGYRLLWDRAGGVSVRVRVGELVGLALPERAAEVAQDWLIGVVRWIRIDEQGGVDAGVELLARRALPIGVRAEHGALRTPLRGLLLASMDGSGAYSSLLAAVEIGRDAGELELTVPADLQGVPAAARSERVSGLESIEVSAAYRRFALPRMTTAEAGVATAEAVGA